jgi:hypothetical protein
MLAKYDFARGERLVNEASRLKFTAITLRNEFSPLRP